MNEPVTPAALTMEQLIESAFPGDGATPAATPAPVAPATPETKAAPVAEAPKLEEPAPDAEAPVEEEVAASPWEEFSKLQEAEGRTPEQIQESLKQIAYLQTPEGREGLAAQVIAFFQGTEEGKAYLRKAGGAEEPEPEEEFADPSEKRIKALERQLAAERTERARVQQEQTGAARLTDAHQRAVEKFGTYLKTYDLNRPEYRKEVELLADDVLDEVGRNPRVVGDLSTFIRGRVNRMKAAGMFAARPKPVTAPKGAASGVVAAGQAPQIDPKLSIEDQIEALSEAHSR